METSESESGYVIKTSFEGFNFKNVIFKIV